MGIPYETLISLRLNNPLLILSPILASNLTVCRTGPSRQPLERSGMTSMKSPMTLSHSFSASHRSCRSRQIWQMSCMPRETRNQSTAVLTSTKPLSSLSSSLAQIRTTQPSFVSRADKVQILRAPAEFYSTLLVSLTQVYKNSAPEFPGD